MSINWNSVGTVLGNPTTSLSAAGVSAQNMPTILNQIGLLSNPNQNEEISIVGRSSLSPISRKWSQRWR